ncbi:uncharacterized protein EAF02_008456 [Botrytis sinoallii]|uniref:uncharacterized protein n=1 Tax=Botrytis sinoallii TaxID=1463999 RepID=UPI0018FFB478|nr:uncharacterized protein EAF02_008456 [Botrytis sinoallii]KAF7874479.1 hypothetical protein EAF02_008456 [Botrytis sinoallii]
MSATEEFGRKTREKHFSFNKQYHPLNHGSFGAFPKSVRDHQRMLQDEIESYPDTFLRYTYPELLGESRRAIAPLLGVEADEVVFVSNATTGINTILRNLVYETGDVVVYFSTIYGACEKTLQSICDTSHVGLEMFRVEIDYPIEDEDIISKFSGAVEQLRSNGRNIKVAIFDTVVTLPGVTFPWEGMVKVCKDLGVLSLIDGAHGIGHIDLSHLGQVGPDFFVSNCYKWLYVPRGCAVLHVPIRNQELIRTTLPTSKSFQLAKDSPKPNYFVEIFQKVSTIDPTPYICIPEALRFRQGVCGGEEKVRSYCRTIALTGGQRMAEILHTEILENQSGSINKSCFVNVRLPLRIVQTSVKVSAESETEHFSISSSDAPHIAKWIEETSIKEYDTMIITKYYSGGLWARISGQIYLEMADFEWAAQRLKDLCSRVERGHWKRV